MELSTSSDSWEPSQVFEVLPEACLGLGMCRWTLERHSGCLGTPGYSGTGLQTHARPSLEVRQSAGQWLWQAETCLLALGFAQWLLLAVGGGVPCLGSMIQIGELALAESFLCSGINEKWGGSLGKPGLPLCCPPLF